MAESMKIRASEIEGLEDFLTEIVRKEIAQRLPTEDMEKLKRSPAGTVIRLEEQVQALTDFTKAEFQNIDKRFEKIESQMVTKEEFTAKSERDDERFIVTKENFAAKTKRDDEHFKKIDARLENMVTKEEFAAESRVIQQQFKTLMIRIDEQDKRISLFQKITYSFLGVMSATMVAILVLVIKLLMSP